LAVVTGLNANKNFFSGIIFLSLPVNFILLFRESHETIKWGIRFVIGAGLFLILILQTRAVWLGACVFLPAMYFLKKIFLKSKTPWTKVIYTIPFLLLMGLFFVIKKPALVAIYERAAIDKLSTGESSRERVKVWNNSLQCIKDNPVAGVGAGNWQYNYLKYGVRDMPSVQKRFTVFQSPHNDYLWVAAETGIIGFILYLAILFLPIRTLIQLRASVIGKEKKKEICILVPFLAGYLFYSFFDFPKYRVEHNFILTVILAGIFNPFTYEEGALIKPSKRYKALFAVIVAGCAIFFGFKIKGEFFSKKMLLAKQKKDQGAIVKNGNAACSFFSEFDPSGIPIQWYMAHAYNNMQRAEDAYIAFKEAEKRSPYNFYILGDLAAAEIIKGNYADAEKHLLSATFINDKYDEGYYNLATLYFYKKEYSQALYYANKTMPSEKHDFFIRTISDKINEQRK
jgi:tetratricopeptide (TPR) repeat protein